MNMPATPQQSATPPLPQDPKKLPLSVRRPWYTRPWRVIGLFVLTLVLALAGAFAVQVFNIKGQIEDGTFDYSTLADDYGSLITTRDDVNEPNNDVVSVSADDDPYLGPEDADIVIIGFEDFECPFCRQAFPEIREVMAKYDDRVKFVFRDFPNSAIHDQAQAAALAGECADDQGKFWEMHDKLYLNQPNFSEAELKGYAKELGLSTAVFNNCFDTGKHLAEIQSDLAAGIAAGATGTPTWFVNGQRVSGPIPSANWELIIESLL